MFKLLFLIYCVVFYNLFYLDIDVYQAADLTFGKGVGNRKNESLNDIKLHRLIQLKTKYPQLRNKKSITLSDVLYMEGMIFSPNNFVPSKNRRLIRLRLVHPLS